jgi:mono/diheme cytochrome c family protein
MDGWDMWSTDAVRPYEEPLPPAVPGTVPTVDRFSLAAGRAALDKMPQSDRTSRAALTYRRYCHHCHGPNGDGRIIVGESLELAPTDLRGPDVQALDDRALFEHVQGGGALMLPFAATLSPRDMLLAIQHLRTLKDRPSKPHFSPKNVRPNR